MKPLGRIVLDRINEGENILWARNINIHDLLSNCEAVFTVNSGAGMEAILHNKPVFCYGKSDYASVSHYILKDEINWSERNKYIKNYKGFFEAYVNSMISVEN
jgi:capsule polysaccharide export protein KpsC/LpsZ